MKVGFCRTRKKVIIMLDAKILLCIPKPMQKPFLNNVKFHTSVSSDSIKNFKSLTMEVIQSLILYHEDLAGHSFHKS